MEHQKAIVYARENGLFEQLEKIYAQVPQCSGCIGCKACCSESVDTTYIEFLYVLNRYYPMYEDLASLPDGIRGRLLKFTLFELAIPQKCPFLNEEGRCEIYEARPLACRVYGTLSRSDYEANYEAVVRQNLEMGKVLQKENGIMPHRALMLRKIPYCEHVAVSAHVTPAMQTSWQNERINLDGKLYFEHLMSMKRLNGNLVGHFFTEDRILDKLPETLIPSLRISILEALQK
ncbi:YkgJ family cysteine cluster protein [Fusibacter paucivorans]|uniref:YkgJ family cysteine cluster protein n=1 Tax=Fusibacter paucivorans TaxID=76009 RepID=A0ABS5PNA2_9FIRM|nr:YkgJ family cysteine cluster protein [Fusibacter paucivorans]MBS7526640.1 YkgJ family cysteine cluster protein [Fusibacter paucivorans]